MNRCEDFAVRKAVIIHQEDYCMARMIDEKGSAQWYDLPNTKRDAELAIEIAKGFGVEQGDISMIEDWTREEIVELLDGIKKEVRLLNGMGKKSFVFVYCAGHGMIDHVSKQ